LSLQPFGPARKSRSQTVEENQCVKRFCFLPASFRKLFRPTGRHWRSATTRRKVAPDRRLVLLRGYARAHGRLQRVELRAMLDTGAQGEFISPSLAKRLGATVEHGRFGVAVEAFGRETPLTQRVRRVELALPGQHRDPLGFHHLTRLAQR